MIRAYSAALRAHGAESVVMILLWALTFTLPGALGLGAMTASASAQAWLEQYKPVIYLADDATGQDAKTLSAELAAWPGVKDVQLRSPDEAIAQLGQRLGQEEVQRLGVNAAMMPSSLILTPNYTLIDYVSLISKVAALEARPQIAATDVPSASATAQLVLIRRAMLTAFVVFALLALISFVLMIAYLKKLVASEREEQAALELFGVSSFELAKASLARGITLGAWAGLLTTVSLLAIQFGAHAQGPALMKQALNQTAAWGWAIALAPLLACPLMGLLAALLATGRRMPRISVRSADLRPLLRYQPLEASL